MSDQADQLRNLATSAPPLARVEGSQPPMVSVTGGRPGVGGTTVAMNLSAALADAGLRVVIIDAALMHANLVQLAGLHSLSHDDLDDVLAGAQSAAGALQPGPHGALVLANSVSSNRVIDDSRRAQQHLLVEVQKLTTVADLVIVDTGTGVTPWARRFWQRSRLVLVVSTTDDAGIRDTYATIKQVASDDLLARICLLINQYERHADADGAHRRLASACQRFLSLELPAMPSLPLAADDSEMRQKAPRVWEEPNSPFGHAVMWLGRAVSDLLATSVAPVNAESSPTA